MVLLTLIGCMHQVSWSEDRAPMVSLPSLQLSVVAMDAACRPLADALVHALGSRPGVEVRPDAAQRLLVQRCADDVTTEIDVEGNYPGLDYGNSVYFERRRYTQNGWARGEMVVSAAEPITFSAEQEDRLRGSWVSQGDLEIPGSPELRDRLARGLASQLADKLVPLPETIRRSVYANPEPGTARQLHNDAVAAERAGNLDEALRLARAAFAADPSPLGMDYLEAVEARAQAVNLASKPQ